MQRSKNSNQRRFSNEQLRSLESIFHSDSRPESRTKQQIANQLGLHPRQVAVWFQNRRARSKSKQVEHDYSILRASYNDLASKFESLKRENQSLINELQRLREPQERHTESKRCNTAPGYMSLSSPKDITPQEGYNRDSLYADKIESFKFQEQDMNTSDTVQTPDDSLIPSSDCSNLGYISQIEHNNATDWWEFLN